MARTNPLTNTEVKQAKPSMKDGKLIAKKLSDGDGLQVKISPNGTKNWILNFKCPYTQKMTSMSFGVYPGISLAEARKLRQSARELLAKGLNPKHEKDLKQQGVDEENSNTFKKAAMEWIVIKKTKVSKDHATDVWRSLESHIFPKLGNIPLNKLTAPKVIAVIKPVAAKGCLDLTQRLCQRINEVMDHVLNTGLIFNNPLSGINKAFEAPKKKHMPTLQPDELPELMTELTQARIKIVTRILIEWQLHTMCRPNEAAGARWDEIDINKRLWSIPAERMKRNRDHTIPLTDQTIALIEFIKPISGHREFLFPSDRKTSEHANSETANTALKRMGFKGRLVAHGLRALASTTLNDQGFDGDVIESCLSHVDKNEVRKAYNRSEYLERRQKVMDWWSNHIEQASIGNMSLASRKGLKVVNS